MWTKIKFRKELMVKGLRDPYHWIEIFYLLKYLSKPGQPSRHNLIIESEVMRQEDANQVAMVFRVGYYLIHSNILCCFD